MNPTRKDKHKASAPTWAGALISQLLTPQPLMPEPQKGIEPLTAWISTDIPAPTTLSVGENNGISSGVQGAAAHEIAPETTGERRTDRVPHTLRQVRELLVARATIGLLPLASKSDLAAWCRTTMDDLGTPPKIVPAARAVLGYLTTGDRCPVSAVDALLTYTATRRAA